MLRTRMKEKEKNDFFKPSRHDKMLKIFLEIRNIEEYEFYISSTKSSTKIFKAKKHRLNGHKLLNDR